MFKYFLKDRSRQIYWIFLGNQILQIWDQSAKFSIHFMTHCEIWQRWMITAARYHYFNVRSLKSRWIRHWNPTPPGPTERAQRGDFPSLPRLTHLLPPASQDFRQECRTIGTQAERAQSAGKSLYITTASAPRYMRGPQKPTVLSL